jgi:hypothetical protein
MGDFLDSIDPDSIPQRFMPELRSIDFRYDSGSHCFHFGTEPVDCNIIACIWDGIHTYKIHTDTIANDFYCVVDNLPAYSPSDGAIWLYRGSMNEWRLLAWWGNPLQLRQHDDIPMRVDYLTELKIAL